jgi:hypothetical protein
MIRGITTNLPARQKIQSPHFIQKYSLTMIRQFFSLNWIHAALSDPMMSGRSRRRSPRFANQNKLSSLVRLEDRVMLNATYAFAVDTLDKEGFSGVSNLSASEGIVLVDGSSVDAYRFTIDSGSWTGDSSPTRIEIVGTELRIASSLFTDLPSDNPAININDSLNNLNGVASFDTLIVTGDNRITTLSGADLAIEVATADIRGPTSSARRSRPNSHADNSSSYQPQWASTRFCGR